MVHPLEASLALVLLVSLGWPCLQAEAQAERDTVRLPGGGFLQGHIIEYVPEEYVRIELADGEVRRLEAAEFEAVETGSEPSTPSPQPSATPLLDIAFETAVDQTDLTVHRRSGFEGRSPRYDSLCAPPCEAQVPASATLAVSSGNGEPIPLSVLPLPSSGRVTAIVSYEGRSDLRAGGWGLTIGGGVAGAVVGTLGFTLNFRCCRLQGENFAVGFAGYGTLAVSLVVGIILIAQNDAAEITLSSLRDLATVTF